MAGLRSLLSARELGLQARFCWGARGQPSGQYRWETLRIGIVRKKYTCRAGGSSRLFRRTVAPGEFISLHTLTL